MLTLSPKSQRRFSQSSVNKRGSAMNEETLSRIVAEAVRSHTKPASITLAKAKKLAAKIEEKAAQMGVNAVVAIADTGARCILCECMDNSYIASYDIATKKAYTAVALKMSTAELKKLAQPGESLYGIQFTNDGQIVVFGGGDPLEYGGGIIGGVGVSGGTEAEDTSLSAYGAGLVAEIMKGD